MPVSVRDWLVFFAAVMLPSAVLSYLCGCINGAILISRGLLHEDVRERGSGNAGLTNFYRNYGPRYAALVLVLDACKMVAAIVITCLFMGWTPEAKLWGGLFCALGHIFPVTFHFKGGKGILSGAALLVMLDWRIALLCIGVFVVLVLMTRYISLGSIAASALAPVAFLVLYWGHWLALALITLTAALLIWSHRGNIQRLLAGTERKFQFR